MFHELGHAIHNIFSRTKYAIPYSRDFIEIPSLMLENWIWIPEVLISLGRHYTCLEDGHLAKEKEGDQDATVDRTLPRSLAEDVARTKTLNKAEDILAQIHPALFDLAIHTPSDHNPAMEMNTTSLWNRTKQKVRTPSFGDNPDDWGFGQAGFPHIFRKYDAGYFAYPT
jgi:metallopeptidase MepB